MKKLFTLLLVLPFIVSMSSCSSDDDKYSANNLQGYMEWTESRYDVDCSSKELKEVLEAMLREDYKASYAYEFKEDGTCLDYEVKGDSNPYKANYKVENKNNLVISDITYPEETQTIQISLKGNKVIFYNKMSEADLDIIKEDLEYYLNYINKSHDILKDFDKLKSIKITHTYNKK